MSIWNISCRRLRTTEGVSRRDIISELRDKVTFCQWRSYTRAHTGQGPGKFLSALVNHVKSTEPVYRIMSHRMPLTYGFSFFARQLQQQIWDPGVSYAVSKFTIQLRSKFTLLIMKDNILFSTMFRVFQLWGCQQVLKSWLKPLWWQCAKW